MSNINMKYLYKQSVDGQYIMYSEWRRTYVSTDWNPHFKAWLSKLYIFKCTTTNTLHTDVMYSMHMRYVDANET